MHYIHYVYYFIPIDIIDIKAIIDIIRLHVALHIAICLQPYLPSLHIAGPAQSPRLNKSHPASVPGTLQALAEQEQKCFGKTARFPKTLSTGMT